MFNNIKQITMGKNKYSSEWIAQHDAKNAADAAAHLRKALKSLRGILSNSEDVEGAIGRVEKALEDAESYKPYNPVLCSH